MNKRNNAGINASIAIYVAIIALLSVCTFAIPFPKTNWGTLVAAYCCALLMASIELGLTISLLFLETKRSQRILGLPIVYSGFVLLILQLIASISFYACNAFFEVPAWILIVVEAILYAMLLIQLAKGFFFKGSSEEYNSKRANTSWMEGFRNDLKALVAKNKNPGISKTLLDLSEKASGSDPISNEKTLDAEKELSADVVELKRLIEEGKGEEAKAAIERIDSLLSERNSLCKSGK